VKNDKLDITEVADGVFRLELPIYFVGYPTVIYIIKGPQPVLVDPGSGSAVPGIQDALKHLAIKQLDYIMLTHLHVDHFGGAGALSNLHPKAKVMLHPRYARHATDPARLRKVFTLIWGENFESRLGPVEAVLKERLLLPKDGDVIDVGGREFQFIYTPGHAPHHIAILDRKTKGLFCGEALGVPDFQMPAAPPNSFDLEAYIASSEKLLAMNLGMKLLFYSHGTAEPDPDVLIERNARNARVYGGLVREGLLRGESSEELCRRVGEHVYANYGVRIPERAVNVTVAGLSLYFKEQALKAG
jgi:glyoxylase-like metal-dependent hydrolase (beta-lactamase superfamily II)